MAAVAGRMRRRWESVFLLAVIREDLQNSALRIGVKKRARLMVASSLQRWLVSAYRVRSATLFGGHGAEHQSSEELGIHLGVQP